MSALVSVIIPLHNGERHLADALASVAAQTHPEVECIVVDDGSTDGSPHIARAAVGVRYVRHPNAGVAVARNTGLTVARGDYLAFLDQDDRFHPEKLARQVAALAGAAGAGLCFVREQVVCEDGQADPDWLPEPTAPGDHLSFVPGTWLVRRDVFQRVGYFDASYRTGSDTDWMFRAREAGVPHCLVEEPLLIRRVHAGNHSHQQAVLRADFLRALRESARRRRARAAPL